MCSGGFKQKSLSKDMLIDERETEKERNIHVKEKHHWAFVHAPGLGLAPAA